MSTPDYGGPVGVPGQCPPREPGPNTLRAGRPNRDAYRHSLVWGLVVWALITVLLDHLDDEYDGAYHLGGAMVIGLGAAVLVGFVARSMTRRVPWWWYPAAVLLVAGAGLAVTDGRRLVEAHRAEATATQRLTLPKAIGHWHRDDSAATRRALRSHAQGVKQPEGVEVAVYRDGSDLIVLTTVTPPSGSKEALEAVTRPDDAVRDAMAGAGVSDYESEYPGGLGGSLACGTTTRTESTPLLICTWAGGRTGALVVFRSGDTDIGIAAAETRAIRKSITTVE